MQHIGTRNQQIRKTLRSSFVWCIIGLVAQASAAVQANPHWGFWAHKRINQTAILRLPVEMQPFFKKHRLFIVENAVNPDRRRYAVQGEAPRHYIDLDHYPDSLRRRLPVFWSDAKKFIPEDTLLSYGIVPWHVQTALYQLTEAFRVRDTKRILRLAADIGHYIADANVPLHTTRNYNGQLTNQVGIHAFWESRLPELFAEDYDLWIGPAKYVEAPGKQIWEAVWRAHAALDTVFRVERELSASLSEDKKYSYETRNNLLVRTYSKAFSERYHSLSNRMVERQFRASVELVGDFWYTAWVNAGQPNLNTLVQFEFSENDLKEEADEKRSWLRRLFPARTEEDDTSD